MYDSALARYFSVKIAFRLFTFPLSLKQIRQQTSGFRYIQYGESIDGPCVFM